MAYAITTLAHKLYAYTTDGNKSAYVSMRTVYQPYNNFALNTAGTFQVFSKHWRRRYIHSPNGGQTSGAMPVERHMPCTLAQSDTPAAGGAIGGAGIDGITNFVWQGYRGQTNRA
jgi:hypothetical protein